eukprot:383976_1
MAVQVVYNTKSLPIYGHLSQPPQQLTSLPNSSNIHQTLSQSPILNTNQNPQTSKHAQRSHGTPFKSNSLFAPFKPHQQNQLANGNIDTKTNIPLKSSTISLAEFACDIEKEITNKVLNKLKLNQD